MRGEYHTGHTGTLVGVTYHFRCNSVCSENIYCRFVDVSKSYWSRCKHCPGGVREEQAQDDPGAAGEDGGGDEEAGAGDHAEGGAIWVAARSLRERKV